MRLSGSGSGIRGPASFLLLILCSPEVVPNLSGPCTNEAWRLVLLVLEADTAILASGAEVSTSLDSQGLRSSDAQALVRSFAIGLEQA